MLQDNYRGNPITTILGKVLEQICLNEGGPDINKGISALQFSFTEARSPGMATLILSEAKVEAYVGTPTCADDVLLLTSNPHELQFM